MSESEKEHPKLPRSSPLRWIPLAALAAGAYWLGITALRKEPGPDSGGPDAEGTGGGFPPSTVIVTPVVVEEVRELRQVTGNLHSVARAEVAAREAGAVDSVLVDVGDIVGKGAPLARMDPRRIEAEIAEAQALRTAATALVEQREAETKRAGTDLEMKEELFNPDDGRRAVSKRELLDAERAEAVAKAQERAARDQLNAVESQMALLEVRQADLAIPAPFDGRVVERHVDPGEWLNPGEPVVTLVSTGTIEAWLHVPERFAASVDGEELQVIPESLGRPVTGKNVRRIADVDDTTRLFPVVADLDDLDGALVPGMSIRAELPVGEKRALPGVPADAVIETRTQAYVFLPAPAPEAEGHPVAEKVPVRVAFRRDGLTWLEPGDLKAGDRVVVEGNERLFPGTPLIISEPETETARATAGE